MSEPIQEPTPEQPAVPPVKRPCKWKLGPSGIGAVTKESMVPREMHGAKWQCPASATWDAQGNPTSDYCGFHSVLMGTRDPVALEANVTGYMHMFAAGYFFGYRLPDGGYVQPPWWGVRFN